MAQIVYECMFILDPNRYARDPGGVSNGLSEMVTNVGGEVLASRLWNEQRLAYPINGMRKGTYWLTYFKVDPLKIPELNRACQLNDNVVRNLILKVEPRLVDTLVAHARGEVVPPEPEAPAPVAVETAAATEGAAPEATTEAAAETTAESTS